MSDYIKREDAIKTVSSLVRDEESFVQEYAIDRIKRIPSADVVEIKHGRLIDLDAEQDYLLDGKYKVNAGSDYLPVSKQIKKLLQEIARKKRGERT